MGDPAGHDADRGSYAAPVVAGQHYTIEGLEWRPNAEQPGDIVIEFSDRQTSQRLGSPEESVSLTLQTSRGAINCVAAASADRSFSTPSQGPESGGYLGDCGEKFRLLAGQPAKRVIERAHRRRWQPVAAPSGGAVAVGPPPAQSVCSGASESNEDRAPKLEGVCLAHDLLLALESADEYTFCGETIRTDGGLHMCNDCAVRCWLQMSGQCVGVVMDYRGGSTTHGSCTYYSRIDRIVHVQSGVAAVSTQDLFQSMTPPPTPHPEPVQMTTTLCADTCACWGQLAGAHACGSRIRWIQANAPGKETWEAAAKLVYDEFPSICKCGTQASTMERKMRTTSVGNATW